VRIGIIAVLYKCDNVIEGFVSSLNKQVFEGFEVLFVNNDVGNDYCENFIRSHAQFPFAFIKNTNNYGVAKANNQGTDYFAKRDDVDYLLFLNPDVEFDADFLKDHRQLAARHELTALVPKIFYYDSEKIWYAGGTLSYLKAGVRHFGHNKKDKLVGKDLFLVSYAPTCSFLIRKDRVLSSNIRMVENLFVYFDDYQFCMDLKKHGIPIHYTPAIRMYHKVSSSTGGNKSEFSRYYTTRNRFYLMKKHRNIMIIQLPIVLLYYLLRATRTEVRAIVDAMKMK
jgi:GT2 family glycosyltransferase